ncbi:DUF932 domain-containing protein [Streptomyces sp. 5.8]|uniref:DUF932 domain-containing protein n=1 Tax=Streptomyces sp. 5.8 TaxID=3406571 RepID=UPI003BB7D0E1
MSALFESGYFHRHPAWHKEGMVTSRPPRDWQEFRVWSGLTWDPVEVPLFTDDGLDFETGQPKYRGLRTHKAVFRSDRMDAEEPLAVVTSTYEVINHQAMGEIAQAVLADREVEMDAGGSLDGGKTVWVLFKLGDPIQIGGDTSLTLPYAAFINSHDGTGALKALSTSVRVVCMNTVNASIGEASRNGTVATIYHTTNWKDRVEEIRLALAGARADHDTYVEWAEALTGFSVTDDDFDTFAKLWFWPKDMTAQITDRVRANIQDAENTFRAMYQSVTCDGIRGNAYGVMQAMGEYLDHGRGFQTKDDDVRRDRHTQRTLMRPEPLKRKAAIVLGDVISQKLVHGRTVKNANTGELLAL